VTDAGITITRPTPQPLELIVRRLHREGERKIGRVSDASELPPVTRRSPAPRRARTGMTVTGVRASRSPG
jgi:hypothetical protein